MTSTPADEPTAPASVDPIIDHESLRDRSDVPVYDEADSVDDATVDTLAGLDDMAVVGVTNDDGDVLLLRVTADCELKVPTASVGPDEDYVDAARQWVESQAGFPISLETVEGMWQYEARSVETDRVATRTFVVFSASPATDDTAGDEPAARRSDEPTADTVRWVDELPDEAVEPPGTRLFFE